MFELRNRGKLDPNTLEEFDHLTGRLRELLSDVVTDDGTLITPDAETEWTTPTFDANAFLGGDAAMVWTVTSAQGALAYKLVGKTMTLAFSISASALSGTPANFVQIRIPDGKVAAKSITNLAKLFDNGAFTVASVSASQNLSTLFIFRLDAAVFTNSANGMYLTGEITFEVK